MKNEGGQIEQKFEKKYEAPNNPEGLDRDFDLFLEQLNNNELSPKERKELESKLSKIHNKILSLIKLFEFAIQEEYKKEKPVEHIIEMHNKNISALRLTEQKYKEYKNKSDNNYDENSET